MATSRTVKMSIFKKKGKLQKTQSSGSKSGRIHWILSRKKDHSKIVDPDPLSSKHTIFSRNTDSYTVKSDSYKLLIWILFPQTFNFLLRKTDFSKQEGWTNFKKKSLKLIEYRDLIDNKFIFYHAFFIFIFRFLYFSKGFTFRVRFKKNDSNPKPSCTLKEILFGTSRSRALLKVLYLSVSGQPPPGYIATRYIAR